MHLPENESHIWYFDIENVSKEIEFYTSFLVSDEVAKANKFKFAKDRAVSILARAALRVLSGRYLNKSPKEIKINYGEYGKPYYEFPTPIDFNLSHSGNYIAIAFARNSKVGVDIEKIKDDFDVVNIAENFFSSDEIQSLKEFSETNRPRAFYRCWTRKESFIKVKGSGLSFPLASFTTSLEEKYPKLLKTEWDPSEKEEWNLFSFEPSSGYIGALTVDKTIQSVKYFDKTVL